MLEIRPNLFFIAAENEGRYPYSHSLYLAGSEKALIDTGAGVGLQPLAAKVDRVVLSHYHRDHLSGNHLFTNAHFSIHHEDAPGVESEAGFFRLSGMERQNIEFYWNMFKQNSFVATPVNQLLADGEILDLGSLQARVIHLPGHTSGHCGFFFEDYDLIFTADIDLTSFGPWYGNTSSDPDQFRQSIKKLIDLKPKIVVTAHRQPLTKQIDQRLAAYEQGFEQRDEAILHSLRKKPQTLGELARQQIIYRHHYDLELLYHFEKVMVEKHLLSLQKKGLVSKQEEGLYALS